MPRSLFESACAKALSFLMRHLTPGTIYINPPEAGPFWRHVSEVEPVDERERLSAGALLAAQYLAHSAHRSGETGFVSNMDGHIEGMLPGRWRVTVEKVSDDA